MAKITKKEEVQDISSTTELVITSKKPAPVEGNFEDIEKMLTKWSAKVSKMSFTEDNLDEVQAIKKAAVAMRNQVDTRVEAAKKFLFNDPKKIFEARMKTLFTLIASVETKVDEVLVKIEDERRDCINEVLDNYKTKFQGIYKLTEEYLGRIEYKKNYYNKGIEEKPEKMTLNNNSKT
jgi:hypothetical protein